jgi:hypothetical protein
VTTERRLTTLLLVLGLIAIPAAALRAFCVGNSCDAADERTDPVPFCSLDPRVRDLVTAGFYEGRSPDVLGVTGDTAVTHAARSLDIPWPSTTRHDTDVPVALLGPAFTGEELSSSLRLDQIAPTLEPLLGFERPFPEVRSGRAIEGATRPGARTPLAVVVVWRGVGMPEIEEAAGSLWLEDQMAADGRSDPADVAAGLAEPGSLPLDPAAVVTTIGTGGLPSQHGITGSILGTDDGFAPAFSAGAPGTVIAALGDDLDQATDGEALVGLVAADRTDRGLIGSDWYGERDDDAMVVERRDPVGQVGRLLSDGWGAGGAPDLLGVTLGGRVASMDATTERLVAEIQTRVPQAAIAITATGSLRVDGVAIDDRELADRVDAALAAPDPVIAGSAAGGFFLDDENAAAQGVTSQQVADAMAAQVADDPATPLFDDTFPSFTVRFGRYC